MESLPSSDEVVTYIRQGFCSWVTDYPSGKRATPEEIWLPALACWVRADGSLITGDQARGSREPGLMGRARIRKAVKWFRAVTDKEGRL